MEPSRKLVWMRSLTTVAASLSLVIAALGLMLILRVSSNQTAELAELRRVAAQNQQLTEHLIALEEQHDEAQARAETRLRDALGNVQALLDKRLDALLRDIRALRFTIQEQPDGSTTVIVRRAPSPEPSPSPERRGKSSATPEKGRRP